MRSVALALVLATAGGEALAQPPVVIGSKIFTESYILAEIMAQTLEAEGIEVERRLGLGGTLICYQALVQGEIDVYPEYSGTLTQTILQVGGELDLPELRQRLGGLGLLALAPFGFDNTYALVVKDALARARGLSKVSDLARHPELRVGFSHEFLNRPDGWPGLANAYGLDRRVSGITHSLAYQAIDEGSLDVTDAYSTDGDLERYRLRVLEDDRGFFPEYRALPLARASLPAEARFALETLGGRIDAERMRALNARAAVHGEGFASIASAFLQETRAAPGEHNRAPDVWQRLGRNTLRHLELTLIALALACAVGLAAGILVHQSKALSRVVLYVAGLLQTIPSIALLALMIPLFGIGRLPAIVALFLYSLLPILRNTITALLTIDPLLRRVSEAIGLTRAQQIRHVLFPLALPNVLAGVKTAAVISIGTATLAAFIGAGGLGEPIVTGLALNDVRLILQGAIPAAILALVTELAFELLERRLVPRHMLSGRLPQ